MTAGEGERWGTYVLEERIASGGMAEVFRARRVGAAAFSRQVCVKRMHGHLSKDPGFVAMFLDEARTGAKLRHRNIVAIDDLGEHGGQYFLAMEYVNGVDLAALEARARTAGVRVPGDAGVFVASEVLAALHAAHTAVDPDTGAPLGVVHRDVSPHNVLVSFGAEVKLTDFGIARAAGRQHVTQGEVVRGRFGYMPLEQAGARGVDARTDLFALGVVLFELLAGRRPFRGDDPDATLETIIAAQVINDRPALADLRDDLPAPLVALVERMLAPQPEGRPPSAQAALAELAGLRESVTGGASLASLMTRLFPGQGSAAAVSPLGIATAPDAPVPERAARATEPVDPYAATRSSRTLELVAETDPAAGSPLRGIASTVPASRSGSRIVGYLALVAGVVLGGGVVAFTMAHRGPPASPAAAAPPTIASVAGPQPSVAAPRDGVASPQGAVVAPQAPAVAPPSPVAAPQSPVAVLHAPSPRHDPGSRTRAPVIAAPAAPVAAPPAPVAPPAAPVAAPPPEGRLRVVVGSAVGTIFIDGREVGQLTSDTRVEGNASHRVHVDGDQPFTREVRVPAGHRLVVRSDDEGHVTVSDQPL